MQKLLIGLIRLYQLTISPFLGRCCRFYPTCSNYAIEALKALPLHKALFHITLRLLRCCGLSLGGVDPIPEKHDEKN